MRTDGIFTTHAITIATRIGDPNYLIPVGDIHYDSDSHAETEFNELMAYIPRERRRMARSESCTPTAYLPTR